VANITRHHYNSRLIEVKRSHSSDRLRKGCWAGAVK
jgi:hypothetical protein